MPIRNVKEIITLCRKINKKRLFAPEKSIKSSKNNKKSGRVDLCIVIARTLFFLFSDYFLFL